MKDQIRLTVDSVVFGYQNAELFILLIKRKYAPYKNDWALPGGFVLYNESLEDAVYRELKEETGIEVNYLEQLYTFGNLDRDPRGHVVSTSYFALVSPKSFTLNPTTDAVEAEWFSTKDLPKLAFDHKKIISLAMKRLQSKVIYEPLGFELLNKKFPFSDLEKLYTTILGRSIDRRNFRKKFLSLNVLDELKEKVSLGAGRPANLFKFNPERYKKLKEEGIIFEI